MALSRMADQIGRVLGGRYRLLAAIGAGASANVFLAEDVVLRRRVAVKVLHTALADDDAFLRRFQAEARAAAALSHPHIMAVYDWGEDDDGPFLVLELLGGGSLRALLDRGVRLTPSQALLVGLHTARGLDYAHRRGLVHRDIKPANLLFDDEGRAKIADFGVARALAEAAWTEPQGAVIGSARYASPEQARGESLDGRSDLYSLALVLIEAVTGTVPFAADTTIATLMARVNNELVVPDELGALGPVVERAGRIDPAERPDAATFATALEAVARELPRPAPLPVGEAVAPLDEAAAVADRDPTIIERPAPPATRPIPVSPRPGPFDQEAADPAATEPAGRRRRRRWPWVALFAVLLAAAAVVAAVAVFNARVPSHPVPVLTGKTVAAARAEVRDEKFEIVTSEAFDENVAAGVVIGQRPAPGASLEEGKAVRLVVSKGPAPRTVPDLSGLDQASAEAKLREQRLTPKFEGRYDENVEKGVVLDWNPKGEVPRDTEITVVVSQGRAPREVPDLTGRTYEEAVAELAKLGLKAARADEYVDGVEVGRVFATNPAAGARAEYGSTVTVRVAKGPKTVTVPDLRNRSVDQARALLEQAGLAYGGAFGPRGEKGRVVYTEPAAGQKVPRGTSVVLFTA